MNLTASAELTGCSKYRSPRRWQMPPVRDRPLSRTGLRRNAGSRGFKLRNVDVASMVGGSFHGEAGFMSPRITKKAHVNFRFMVSR